MAFIQIEDGESTAEVVLFPKTFAQVESWLSDYHVFLIKGAIDITDPKQLKIKAFQMAPIDIALQEWPQIQHAILELPAAFDQELMASFKENLVKGSIPTSLLFSEQGKKLRLKMKQKIALDGDTLSSMAQLGITAKIVL